METIVPSVDTTKEELQERVDYMVNTASHLEELAETDEHEAMKEFIALKNFAYEEYHVLTLQKNEKAEQNARSDLRSDRRKGNSRYGGRVLRTAW